jgi:hypothetical protein
MGRHCCICMYICVYKESVSYICKLCVPTIAACVPTGIVNGVCVSSVDLSWNTQIVLLSLK